MNALFVMQGCHVCRAWKEALLELSSKFRVYGLQIDVIYVETGDPRCSALAQLFESWSPSDWLVPVLIMDMPGGEMIYDNYILNSDEVTGRTVTQSLVDKDHCKEYLKQIFNRWYA